MQLHQLIQGSPAWLQFRLERYTAGEAAAMLGMSPYVTRNDLLEHKATGTAQEFSDWVQKHILDYGHEVEALARPLVEHMIGQDLYPVTASEGMYSASCDGLTMDETIAFEHKQWNTELAAAVAAGVVPDHHQPQCQQILMVTGAEKVIFVCSDGTPKNFVYTEVFPSPEWQARIRAGWEQFAVDLVNFERKEFAPKPQAEVIMQLPALSMQIRGEVAFSNLPAFKAKAEEFIASIKTDLTTDEDFANAEAQIKFCDNAEKALEQAKAAALAQTVDIDLLMRTVDHISEQLREKRLLLTRTVKDKKESIKYEILTGGKSALAVHIISLEAELAPLRLPAIVADFAGAMKNKRTLESLHNAVDTTLANAKIEANEIAKAMRSRLSWYRANVAGYDALFADLQSLILKADDDFHLAVTTRINAQRAKEAEQAQAVITKAQVQPMPTAAPQPAPVAAPRAKTNVDEPPTMRLCDLGQRLGFTLSSEFLTKLGFPPVARSRNSMLYRPSDFPAICAALVAHLHSLQSSDQLVGA